MDSLPVEIVLNITTCRYWIFDKQATPAHSREQTDLETYSIVRLSLVSKHLHHVVSDNEVWRTLCFRDSNSRHACKQALLRPVVEPRLYNLQEAVARTEVGKPDVEQERSNRGKGIALWDCSLPQERIDWQSDYIGRHAALDIDWIYAPEESRHVTYEDCEARGLAAIDETRVLAPLGDGSIRIWDTSTQGSYGRTLGSTRPGLLFDAPGREIPANHVRSVQEKYAGTTSEGLSVDKIRNKAYVVVGKGLVELDLTTLKVTAHDRYPEVISALSPALPGSPLTVGTAKALYIYDPRAKSRSGMKVAAIQEHMKNISDFYRLISGDPGFAPLAEPLPLSILHSSDHNIHAAGRFPSILNYDRRYFPRVASTIHSGARLSCLSAVPSESGSIRLAAAGDYNGKGSVELYTLSTITGALQENSVRNRTSVSRSKCLSIVSHGSRLLFSDGDGMVKWVERDGSTPVRRWNINSYSENIIDALNYPGPRGGIFGADVSNGDVARRLLPMTDSPDSDVCVWTGEKIGVMHVGKKRILNGGMEEKDDSAAESVSGEEQSYGRMMRRALERQADEVRFMTTLGLGRSL